ncbi:hypothetical protein [Paenibacillus sp. FSL L8-0709]|uniref:hypothetical protein n=1 Tax=Paenibacillus sp. FSL L8-0709 TaxID=2975312 RepID=UPI0030F98271
MTLMAQNIKLSEVREIIADIAFTAGHLQATGLIVINDSRELVNDISIWTDEFMNVHDQTDWDKELYLEAVDDFATLKLLSKYGSENNQ